MTGKWAETRSHGIAEILVIIKAHATSNVKPGVNKGILYLDVSPSVHSGQWDCLFVATMFFSPKIITYDFYT